MVSESVLGIFIMVVAAVLGVGTTFSIQVLDIPEETENMGSMVETHRSLLVNTVFPHYAKKIAKEDFVVNLENAENIRWNYDYEIESLSSITFFSREMPKVARRMFSLLYIGVLIIAPLGVIFRFLPAYSYLSTDYIFLSLFVGDMFLATYSYILFRYYRNQFKGLMGGLESGRRSRARRAFKEDEE